MPSKPRNSSEVFRRRTERARLEGWTSYGQKRYWLARFTSDPAGTARRLASKVCQGHQEGRGGSYLCTDCNERVNPRDEPRAGDWRARLVNGQ